MFRYCNCTIVLVSLTFLCQLRLAQRLECGAEFCCKKFWLLPGREVSALVELVVIYEFGIRLLCPTPRCLIELVRKDAHGNRDGDALDGEKGELVLPVETSRRNRSVSQPVKRDIVEDIVSRKAFGVSVKGMRDQLQTTRVMVSIQAAKPTGESASPFSVCGRVPINGA